MAGEVRVFSGSKAKKVLWRARVFSTASELMRGIMGSPTKFPPALFIFPSKSRLRNAIHSLFCPCFDAVFLDEQLVVVDVKSVSPFSLLVVPLASCKYLLELPSGEALRKRVTIGSRLSLKFVV